MRDKIDFKKIVYYGELIGVLNFNLMIPVEDVLIQKIDTKIRKHDNADTRKKKELLIKELEWCNEHARALTNTANVLYAKYIRWQMNNTFIMMVFLLFFISTRAYNSL